MAKLLDIEAGREKDGLKEPAANLALSNAMSARLIKKSIIPNLQQTRLTTGSTPKGSVFQKELRGISIEEENK